MISSPDTPAPFDPRIVPAPPRLHWGILLALQIVTVGLFQLVWLPVQALWVKRITGKSTGFTWAIVTSSLVGAFLLVMMTIGAVGAGTGHAGEARHLGASVSAIFRLVYFVLNLIAVFTLRSQMEAYPIGMSLGGVMTFFFQSIYFQYHMMDYVLPDAREVYGELPASPAYVPPQP